MYRKFGKVNTLSHVYTKTLYPLGSRDLLPTSVCCVHQTRKTHMHTNIHTHTHYIYYYVSLVSLRKSPNFQCHFLCQGYMSVVSEYCTLEICLIVDLWYCFTHASTFCVYCIPKIRPVSLNHFRLGVSDYCFILFQWPGLKNILQ